MSRALRLVFVVIGLALLGAIVAHTDLGQVGGRLTQLGVLGAAAVLALYLLAFSLDTAVWLLTFAQRRPNLGWLARLFQIKLIGEAVNNATPLGSVGGEPVKALLLRRYFGIALRDGAASLVLTKTCVMVGLVLFLTAGFALMLASPSLPATMKLVAGAGLLGFAIAIALMVAVQRFQLATRAGGWLGRGRYGERLKRWLGAIYDMDRQLMEFYSLHLARFFSAVALSTGNWLLGAAELVVVMAFFGQPLAFADAVAIEALAQLVRAGTFFIPLSLGAQEGTFMLALGAITGAPALGLAVAFVRRGRELLWLLLGLLMFWRVSGRELHPDAPSGR
ncbi:MAG: lysylphosphatidylglycerol synthase transmembrane domain-containing protein [Rhodospirillales bacterium]